MKPASYACDSYEPTVVDRDIDHLVENLAEVREKCSYDNQNHHCTITVMDRRTFPKICEDVKAAFSRSLEFPLGFTSDLITCDQATNEIEFKTDYITNGSLSKSVGNVKGIKGLFNQCYEINRLKRENKEAIEELVADADEYFLNQSKARMPIKLDFKPSVSTKELFKSLLASNKDIVVGETHSDISAKKALIENMKTLGKENAVIALEHIFHYPYQKMLDAYILGESKKMPKNLEFYLETLDEGHDVKNNKYGFKALVKAAREHAVRIVAYESKESYLSGTNSGVMSDSNEVARRLKAMNYLEKVTIDGERRGAKVVHLVGSAHLHTRLGVPGLAELYNSPSIAFADKKGKREVSFAVDEGSDEGIKADIVIKE